MQKIKLTGQARDMRVIAWLLKMDVENPVQFDYKEINSAEFLISFTLVNLFKGKFNQLVFEERKYQVSLTQAEAVSLLQRILEVEGDKDIELGQYSISVFSRIKSTLHQELVGLPTYDNLPG